MSLLGTVKVADPDAGSMAIQHIGHHTGSVLLRVTRMTNCLFWDTLYQWVRPLTHRCFVGAEDVRVAHDDEPAPGSHRPPGINGLPALTRLPELPESAEVRNLLTYRQNASASGLDTGYKVTLRSASALCWTGVGLVSTVSG